MQGDQILTVKLRPSGAISAAERSSFILATVTSVCAFSTGFAQTAPVSSGDQVPALQEIIVTAQKKSQGVQEVPMSMAVIESSSLIDQNLVSLSDISSRVPGLDYFGSQQSDLAIRGITTGGGTNPTVAVTIDDVPVGSSSYAGQSLTPDLDPAILSQIEVLRGPQSTLYGANSLGGLIKYVTKEPDPNVFSGNVQLDGETVDQGNQGGAGRASVNVPLIADKMGLLLSGFYRDDPAYIDDVYPSESRKDSNVHHAYGGTADLLIKPTDQLTIDLWTMLQRQTSFGTDYEYLAENYSPQTGDLQQSSLLGPLDADDRISSLRVNYDFGRASLTSITGYSSLTDSSSADATSTFGGLIPVLDALVGFTANPDDRVIGYESHSTHKISEELRLASEGAGPLTWLVGLFYTHEQTQLAQAPTALDATGSLPIASIVAPSTYEEKAAFADITYYFTDKFDVQLGDRYAGNNQTFSDDTAGPLITLEYGTPVYDLPKGTSHETANTWLVNPEYHFTPNLMGYLRVATGYRPGGPNVALPTVPDKTFESDTVTNYEVGIKDTALDHRLLADADVFYIDWNRIELQETDPVSRSSFFGNGSKARSSGVEGSITYRPWVGMTLGVDAAYTDAILTASLPVGPTSDIYGLNGDVLPFSPKFTGNLSIEQTWPVTGVWTGYVGGDLAYVGSRYGVFPENQTVPRIELPAYTDLDLRTGMQGDKWSFELFVKNATNKRGFVTGQLLNALSGAAGYEVMPIQPRTIGISLSRDF